MVIPEERSFAEHSINAEEMGCILATASDMDELQAIKDAATAQEYNGPGANRNLFFIGLRRRDGTGLDPTNGDPGGPWMWTDGCTEYRFNPFAENEFGSEPNNAGNERFGGVLFDDINELQPGDINDTADNRAAALYECCVW